MEISPSQVSENQVNLLHDYLEFFGNLLSEFQSSRVPLRSVEGASNAATLVVIAIFSYFFQEFEKWLL